MHFSQVGSKKADQHEIAVRVFNVTIQYQICLEPEWVLKELNKKGRFAQQHS